jgi:hypothetical protein
MSLCNEQNLSQAILRYLLRHPNAQDTLEGISEWWILEERIIQKYVEVQAAIKKLVGEGFVIEKRIPHAGVFYCLNRDKKELIKELIDEENGSA